MTDKPAFITLLREHGIPYSERVSCDGSVIETDVTYSSFDVTGNHLFTMLNDNNEGTADAGTETR